MFKTLLRPVLLLALLMFAQQSFAKDIKPMTDDEKKAVWEAANAASVNGPADVGLGQQAKLHLYDNHVYVPKKEAAAIMRMWGNGEQPDGFYGLVFDKSPDVPWVIGIDFVGEGYVKDDDAKTWDADELLQSLKDGTAAGNEDRVKMGIPPLEVTGWIQPPLYDSSKHQLAWSLKAINPEAPSEPATVNYNTYALGREGYIQVNLMTTDATVEKDKAEALKVVSAVDYNEGKRYADFNADTDHVAEYGLAALVAGVAAKKLGILAVAGVFIAKFFKIILALLAVAGGTLFKIFRKSSD